MEKNRTWLPHLETSLPEEVFGYPISMYSVALEGWRRGLSLSFENNNRVKAVIKYSLSDGTKTHSFTGSRGDLVTRESINICKNKHLTKDYLAKAGVSVAEGEFFNGEVNDDYIIDYGKKLGFPSVIKPISAAGGKGVIANIKNEKEFIEALNYVRNDLNYKEIIVERHIDGDDYRVYVVGDKVAGAVKRIPANIIGDGVKTVSQLLKENNVEKKRNPALTDSPIRKDKEMTSLLTNLGYTMRSIPKKGERVFLKSKSNISAGGEPVDATDLISAKVKENAIKAIGAIPGLAQAGVDILWDSKTNNIGVLEINTQPSIRTHLFPIEGHARDVAKIIVDFYFPETKSNHNFPLYYFGIGHVLKEFTDNTLTEATIPNHPEGTQKTLHLIIPNVEDRIAFSRNTFKLAKKLQLNGYILSGDKKSVEIVVSGKVDVVNEFKNYLDSKAKYQEYKWTKPVKIGFERIKNEVTTNQKFLDELDILKKENERLKKETEFYRNKYKSISNSRGWRFVEKVRSLRK